jgi:NitT/TauT family transport system substrate-binding protein
MVHVGAYADYKAKGKKINVTYVSYLRGIKLFADQAFYATGGGEIAPFLLKKDAGPMRPGTMARCLDLRTR